MQKNYAALLAITHGTNQSFHMVQITLESPPAERGEMKFGLRKTAIEGLRTGDISRFLKFAGMYAQIAVCRFEQSLELIERKRLIDGQCAHDPQPHSLVYQPIQIRGYGLGMGAANFQGFGGAGPASGRPILRE